MNLSHLRPSRTAGFIHPLTFAIIMIILIGVILYCDGQYRKQKASEVPAALPVNPNN